MDMPHLRLLQFSYTDLCEWGDPAFQWFLARTDPAFALRPRNRVCPQPPVSAQVGATGGTLSSPGDGTTYSFAPGTFGSAAGATIAVAGAVTVTHTPKQADAAPPTGALAGIRHFYEADARDAGGQPVQPLLPYTVTITFGPADLTSGRVLSSTLALYVWNGTAWEREPTSRLDAGAYTVTADTQPLVHVGGAGPGAAGRHECICPWWCAADREGTYLPVRASGAAQLATCKDQQSQDRTKAPAAGQHAQPNRRISG